MADGGNYPPGMNWVRYDATWGADIPEPRDLTAHELACIAAVAMAETRCAEALHAIRSMPQIDETNETADARDDLGGIELDLGGILAQLRDVVTTLRAVPEKECEI